MSSSSESETMEGKKRRRIYLGLCRYDIVSRVALDKDYKFVADDSWHISWTDAPLPPERIMELRRLQNMPVSKCPLFQKMNHFPGMYEICRKDRLGRNLNRLKKIHPTDYNFFPSTWDLPSDMSDLLEYWRTNRNATFIIKPDSGCQGKGIFLIRNVKTLCPFAKCVCQLYVSHPFLIDGYKFDSRLYVLITSVDPLRIYLFEEGIARFATVKYQVPNHDNLDVTFMHLTNYSLNKYSDSYDPQLGGSKRKLTEVYNWMAAHNYDVDKLKQSINDIIVKTIVSVAPTLRHNYRASLSSKKNRGCYCFDVLGFDILIDRNLTPMLLEVNHSPSLNVDLQVDQVVKYDLVSDILDILYLGKDAPNGRRGAPDTSKIITRQKIDTQRRPGTFHPIQISDHLKEQFSHEEMNMGKFQLIFREECPGRFARYMDKDYCESISREQRLFVKKKLEPYAQTSAGLNRHNLWSDSPQKTTFRRLPSGEILAETKTVPPGVLDPDAFLKFKSSVITNKPKPASKSGSQKSIRGRKKVVSPLIADDKRELTEQHTLLHQNPFETIPESELYQKTAETLTAHQRVQVAIEKLRRKNLQKFTRASERNDRPNSASTVYSEPSFFHSKNKTSMTKEKVTVDYNNNILNNFSNLEAYTDINEAILDLDTSKLPSIFQNDGNTDLIEGETKIKKVAVGDSKDESQAPKDVSNADMVERWIRQGIMRPKTQLGSFEPQQVDEDEEKQRIKSLAQREQEIQQAKGLSETIREIIERANAPTPDNRKIV